MSRATTSGRGQHLARSTPRRCGSAASSSTRPRTSASISGVSGAPAHSTSCTSGGSCGRGAQEERQALLPGDPADEDHAGPVGVDAELAHPVGVVDRGPVGGVDAVVHHVHACRVDGGIAAQHVVAHGRADRDDAGGALVRRPLHPARERVAAAELLGLPRPHRLQRVGADDVRDAVHEAGEVAGHVGVPRVRVHEVGARRSRRPSPGRRPGCGSPPLAPASEAGSAYAVVPASSRGAPKQRTRASTPGWARSARTSSATWTPAPP